MSAPLLIGIFLFLVFAPCLVAFGDALEDSDLRDKELRDKEDPEEWEPACELEQVLFQPMEAEVALAENFRIRSFPKGLSQRRLLLRDSEGAVRLTIMQLRCAAAELVRLGGIAVAYELALAAAASAAAMSTVKDAFAVAARHWLAWAETRRELHRQQRRAWEAEAPERGPSRRRWHEVLEPATQAA
jgi:hypothetical protein